MKKQKQQRWTTSTTSTRVPTDRSSSVGWWRTRPAAAGASTKENPRMPYATGSAGLANLVRGSSRRITIMRFRPANIRLINRRSNLPRLRLAVSSKKAKAKKQRQKQPHRCAGVDRVTPYQGKFHRHESDGNH